MSPFCCECCWRDKQGRQFASPSARVDLETINKEHEARGCVCSNSLSEAGRRAQAGQFWDDERKIDVRELEILK